ncbi:unnamed protein product [Clonostachys rhizophaga]|uniref:GFO/IDH/MocA-like oxidoreductase domain-containing protein n=1 Tax=Clonostachys rhizophaga TaxID=160324 RepID=A0A9N9YI78_9HYPO|nr:unnamed protein product [Clonostachys rhizophaga]
MTVSGLSGNKKKQVALRTTVKLIRERILGDIIESETHFDWDDPGWPSNNEGITEYIPGQGMLYGLGTHTIDQAMLLFGRPESVFAIFKSHCDGSRGSAIDDWHTLIPQYAKEKNQSVVNHLDIQEEQIFAGKYAPLYPEFGLEPPEQYGELTTTTSHDLTYQAEDTTARQPRYVGKIPTTQGNWKGFYEDLAQSIQGGSDFLQRVDHARDVIRLLRERAQTREGVSPGTKPLVTIYERTVHVVGGNGATNSSLVVLDHGDGGRQYFGKEKAITAA